MLKIIGGKFKKRVLKTVRLATLRPTSSMIRESLFNICQQDIERAIFFDLFAGTGAVGLEALSRGAKTAYFVENNKQAVQCIKENISLLQVQDQCKVFSLSVERFLHIAQLEAPRIIFMDPPYKLELENIKKLLIQIEQKWMNLPFSVFIERNYEKKEEKEIFSELQILKLQEKRRYGSSLLLHFRTQ